MALNRYYTIFVEIVVEKVGVAHWCPGETFHRLYSVTIYKSVLMRYSAFLRGTNVLPTSEHWIASWRHFADISLQVEMNNCDSCKTPSDLAWPFWRQHFCNFWQPYTNLWLCFVSKFHITPNNLYHVYSLNDSQMLFRFSRVSKYNFIIVPPKASWVGLICWTHQHHQRRWLPI